MGAQLKTPGNSKLTPADVVATLAAHGLAGRRAGLSDLDRSDQSSRRAGVLRTDSRKIERGDVFLAYRGVASDGHDHLAQAASQGAALLVVEDVSRIPAGLTTPWVETPSGRAAWARLAASAHGDPQARLTVLGVTGTNGKTSTAWMTGQLLKANGMPSLVIGTLGAYLADTRLPTAHTTPDPDALYGLFALALSQGVRVAVMEVSSHAIAQEKVGPIRFSAAAFTSFSRDHLDFHGTMADYGATKRRLFTELCQPGAVMAFADVLDPAPALVDLPGEPVVYGFDAETRRETWGARRAFTVRAADSTFQGTDLTITAGTETWRGKVPYFARHALENFAAAVVLASTVLGRFPDPKSWHRLAAVPGRLEQVRGDRGPAVVVDYAHTPDALEKTLTVVRPLTAGRLVVVFGCGGDRDKGKRPLMGRAAELLADRVYLTSDNPRSEAPEAILADIAAGMRLGEKRFVEPDRAKAIALAIGASRAGDLVVIAGKGHETYQILNDRTLPFDDRDVAARCLANA